MKITNLAVTTCALLASALPGFAALTITGVNTVPWNPASPTDPHTVIQAVSATLTATAVFSTTSGTDSYSYQWNYGDPTITVPPGGASAVTTIGNTGNSTNVGDVYNLSTTHTYPNTIAAGTPLTAVITVTDTTTSTVVGTAIYYIIVQQNDLQARVNVAIDNGLWFLHTTMERGTTPNASSVQIPYGGWDGAIQGCRSGYNCLDSGGFDATSVQAFEVSGHYENGPASDPYTDDVSRGLARVMQFTTVVNNTFGTGVAKTIGYNPALTAIRCSDGSQPTYSSTPTCTTGTLMNYNPNATSCTSPPCSFVYDSNGDKEMVYEANDGEGDPGYQTGMLVTAIVAGQNPTGVAKLGPSGVQGQTYLNIVDDLTDAIGFCQWYGDSENSNGDDNGGGWEYGCSGNDAQSSWYDDNSPSQWNAIALIAANRGFGVPIPQIVLDANQVWDSWDEDISDASSSSLACAAALNCQNAFSITAPRGQFGYNAWNDPIWGPWAVTPSGMVQLAMVGVGRSNTGNNKAVTGTNSNGTTVDNRWDLAESFYHDNFCNVLGNSAYYDPKLYTYGLFSFTKAMEQHDPGGVLTSISQLADQPANTNQFDWYNAQASLGAPCDGVAQTLVSKQNSDGHWYGVDYTDPQYRFDTAWDIIMLQKTSFVACVSNLGGAGKASSRSSGAEATLTWTGIADASSYEVLRSTSSGGSFVALGAPDTNPTTNLAFVDQGTGLTNGLTYYYELQPLNAAGVAVCTSNVAPIKIP